MCCTRSVIVQKMYIQVHIHAIHISSHIYKYVLHFNIFTPFITGIVSRAILSAHSIFTRIVKYIDLFFQHTSSLPLRLGDPKRRNKFPLITFSNLYRSGYQPLAPGILVSSYDMHGLWRKDSSPPPYGGIYILITFT